MESNDLVNNKDFARINLTAIEQVRGDRFSTNYAHSGFNGKNIVLTGRMKISTITIQGETRQSIRLECIYFNTSPKDGKLGTITLSAFSARQLVIGEAEPSNVVEGANQYSERELLELLNDGVHYLRYVATVTVATANFIRENGRVRVEYDQTKPKTGYKYVIAELLDEQKAELDALLASIRPTQPTNPAGQTGQQG